MEMSETTDDADEAYMTMDADQWPEDDNTYATADELDLDLTQIDNSMQGGTSSESNEQKRNKLRRDAAAVNRPRTPNPNPRPTQVPVPARPDRYITIKPPPKGQNRGPAMTQLPHSTLSRYTAIILLVLCSLLIAVICALSINYVILSKDRNELLEKKQDLTQQIKYLKSLSLSKYYIFDTSHQNKSDSKKQLFILNYEVLQEKKRQNFYLASGEQTNHTDNRNCSWYCEWS